jgi:hypothetical protein
VRWLVMLLVSFVVLMCHSCLGVRLFVRTGLRLDARRVFVRKFVCECYIDGVMGGEGMSIGQLETIILM